jgi:hypothetical protein
MVLPDTESISPATQSLPFVEGDGADEVGLEFVGLAALGLALFDAPHAATDNAVAPVTATIAKRVSREVGRVAGIGVLSVVCCGEQADYGNGFHDRWRR